MKNKFLFALVAAVVMTNAIDANNAEILKKVKADLAAEKGRVIARFATEDEKIKALQSFEKNEREQWQNAALKIKADLSDEKMKALYTKAVLGLLTGQRNSEMLNNIDREIDLLLLDAYMNSLLQCRKCIADINNTRAFCMHQGVLSGLIVAELGVDMLGTEVLDLVCPEATEPIEPGKSALTN